ncbi:MAG: nickel pincer cofactor biosynthesis protein LarC [Synergistaceae bacterium]|nr:nickel pincer cofactor biosynthesis protein LarC [Synergistaceae bacterium]
MKTLYLDCFAGIAGDMFIGALLNLVPNMNILTEGIRKLTALNPEEYELIIERTTKNGIAGINFDVHLKHEHHHKHEGPHHEHDEHEHGQEHHHHHHRHLADIEAMITASELPSRVKVASLRAFSLLAEAEANVHGTTPDKIHFHEVGAVDSIIDIVGSFILVDALGWPRVLCSSINVGSGTVECAHGILPVPAPATEKLLHGLPVYSAGTPMERTTPTGALLVKVLADGFSSIPAGKILASGYGLGNRESPDMPNMLRVMLIDAGNEYESDGLIHERITLLECNIDDMNPQDYEPVIGKLFLRGGLDVWTENIAMKKARPGVKLCCLCKGEASQKLSRIILEHTTSQGVRLKEFDRVRLNWRIEEADTSLGKIRVKTTDLGGEELRRIPEYEDVKEIAQKHDIPMYEARRMILREL